MADRRYGYERGVHDPLQVGPREDSEERRHRISDDHAQEGAEHPEKSASPYVEGNHGSQADPRDGQFPPVRWVRSIGAENVRGFQ